MKVTRENIYRLIAGTIGVNIKTFNPNLNMINAYNVDSLAILDLSLVIEDYTGYYVEIPKEVLPKLKTASQYADYVLEQYNASS